MLKKDNPKVILTTRKDTYNTLNTITVNANVTKQYSLVLVKGRDVLWLGS